MSNFLKEVNGVPRGTAMVLADLPSIANNTFLGNISGSAGTPSALTATQVTANLNLFTSSLQGLTPSSGGGTANFLRADGTWAVPPGSGSGTVTSVALSAPAFLSVGGSPVTTSGTLALSYSGTAIPIANGGTAKTSVTTAPAATSWAGWDANSNLSANNVLEGYATTATAAGTTTLTVGSAYQQFFTGTTTQTVVLPVTSTLVLGQKFLITNASSGIVTVESSGANTVIAQSGSSSYLYTCVLTSGTTAASWYAVPYSGGGAVTPTVTVITSGSGTFTTPSNALYIQVKMVGGGGGGAGNGGTGQNGSNGGNTTFGTSLLTANGGSGATAGSGASGGSGGTATVAGSAIALTVVSGGTGSSSNNLSSSLAAGMGGSNPFGGAGAGGGGGGVAGGAASANTGGGGGGQGGTGGAITGNGGGAGGYLEAIITSPSSTYSYSVGALGAGYSSGTVGGNGAAGIIIVTTYYNNGAVGTATNVTGVVAQANGGTGLTTSYNGRYFSSTTTISGSLATVVYATKGFDAQSSYNNSTGIWTCPVTGKYQFNAGIATAGTVALNSALDMQIQQSGSASQISEYLVDGAAGLTNLSTSVSDIFNCVAGDTVKVQVSSGATTPTIVSSNSRNYFSWSWLGT